MASLTFSSTKTAPVCTHVTVRRKHSRMKGYGALTPQAYAPPRPGPAPQPPLLGGDTGPAAETLKQMAAQHQNHDAPVGYTGAPVGPGFGVQFTGYRPTHPAYEGAYPMAGFGGGGGAQYGFMGERKATFSQNIMNDAC